MTSRAASLSVVILLWAALYLPLFGLSEFRGEEGKRVMPAVQMLDDGSYLAPYLGARPLLNNHHASGTFYVCALVVYLSTLEQLPANSRFLLIQYRELPKMETNARWHDLQPGLFARPALSQQ